MYVEIMKEKTIHIPKNPGHLTLILFSWRTTRRIRYILISLALQLAKGWEK